MNHKDIFKKIRLFVTMFLIAVIVTFVYLTITAPTVKKVSFSEMTDNIRNNKVSEVTIQDNRITAKTGKKEYITTTTNNLVDIEYINNNYIYRMMEKGKIKYNSEGPKNGFTVMNFISIVFELLIAGLFIYAIYIMASGKGSGKTKSRKYKGGDSAITFNDVAGLAEEKQELMELVDFLKDPEKYKNIGARIPKGVLLFGPPGTGKTYISKAVAGEAGVPFFSISGSEFVEMFVGVGASRVRNLFEEAKKEAPCIVFIDEIDAVGRQRGAGLGGGNDEREQTLNQLLVAMDGFDENSGIIVLAATNRPDVLDPALLRPGRFDRQITIGLPDIKGREEIVKLHSRNKPFASDISPEIIARRTPGFTPADLENLLNEAALLTARRNDLFISMEDIEEAITKVMAGPAKKSRVISPEEKRLTAYHEAGHAVVMTCLPGSDPVHQITIIPRGAAGGFTMQLPEKDKHFETRTDMFYQIVALLGGRVSEELFLKDISTGASNDIHRATEIARDMVTKYGFSSSLGPVDYSGDEEVFLGRDYSKERPFSDVVQKEIDDEVRNFIENAYELCKKILSENKENIKNVADALIRVETLNGEQFLDIYNKIKTPKELEKELG